MIEYLAYWTIAAFLIFIFNEMMYSMMPPGELKKEVKIVLDIIYLPLYVIGAVLYVLVELYNFRPNKFGGDQDGS